MAKMKTITVSGQVYEYEVYGNSDYDGSWAQTRFFQGTRKVTKRKHWLFGGKMVVDEPVFVFSLPYDINSVNRPKEETMKTLEGFVKNINTQFK